MSYNAIIRNTANNISGISYNGNGGLHYNTISTNISAGGGDTYAFRLSDGLPSLNYNNIFNNTTTFHLYNYGVSGSTVNAENNWWGTSNQSEIEDKIYHFLDDASKGTVDYIPFDTAIRTDCPISPPAGLISTGWNSIQWSPNPEADVAGYIVYWDTDSGFPYEHSVNVGNVTSYTVPGFSYEYVTVTAYDSDYSPANDDPDTIVNDNMTNGNESWFAVELEVGL